MRHVVGRYVVSCKPSQEDDLDLAISKLEQADKVISILQFLVVDKAPMDIISELCDLAAELNIKIEDFQNILGDRAEGVVIKDL